MNKKTLKTALAWVVGIASWVVIVKFFNILSQSIDVPTYIDFGETITVTRGSGRQSYDEDIDGEFTTVGTAFNFLSLMFAARIGMAAHSWKLSGGVSKKGNIDFIAWAAGITIFGIMAAMLFKIFGSSESDFLNILRNILELVIGATIFYFGKNWRDRKILQIEELNLR